MKKAELKERVTSLKRSIHILHGKINDFKTANLNLVSSVDSKDVVISRLTASLANQMYNQTKLSLDVSALIEQLEKCYGLHETPTEETCDSPDQTDA